MKKFNYKTWHCKIQRETWEKIKKTWKIWNDIKDVKNLLS